MCPTPTVSLTCTAQTLSPVRLKQRVSKDKKYDGWTKDEIKDECNNPKNCNACKRDCPSRYKKGCKEYKGCGDTDEEALAFA